MLELERIYNILESFLGESKQGGYDGDTYQYQWDCPYCADEKGGADGKKNLEVSLKLLKFHCWSCGSSGSLSKLIRMKGGKSSLKEYMSIIEEMKSSRLYDINLFSEIAPALKSEVIVKLPKTFKKIDLNDCDLRAKKYLESRNITQEIIDKFNIGYTSWDDSEKSWSYRIIIPSYDEFGRLNYFTGRDFLPNGKESKYIRTKYKNCDADKNDIVFQEGNINWDADITLVEGAIDCIYGPNTISLLGKSLKKDTALYKTLYNKANGRIIICLDADTDIKETVEIYNTLNFGRLRGKIWYIRLSDYKDFGEIYETFGKKGIMRHIHQAKQFSDFDLTKNLL